VELPEDEPVFIARMILFFYSGDYVDGHNRHSHFGVSALEELMTKAASDPSRVAEDMRPDIPEIVIAAHMYGLAEKYVVEGLDISSRERFREELVLKSLTVSTLLTAVETVYDQTRDGDDAIRRWVVWRCQKVTRLLNDSKTYLELLERRPEFARDMLTKYSSRNYLWCQDCRRYIDFECCDCGWSGMCGLSCPTDTKANDILPTLTCTSCHGRGRLQLRRPESDEVDVLDVPVMPPTHAK